MRNKLIAAAAAATRSLGDKEGLRVPVMYSVHCTAPLPTHFYPNTPLLLVLVNTIPLLYHINPAFPINLPTVLLASAFSLFPCLLCSIFSRQGRGGSGQLALPVTFCHYGPNTPHHPQLAMLLLNFDNQSLVFLVFILTDPIYVKRKNLIKLNK